MIAVLDYGAGNLRSVQNALEAVGAEYLVVNDAAGLRNGRKIILPGVGHFGQMMRALDRLAVRAALKECIAAGTPFLGICLGLQALLQCSAEAPEVAGLGIFEGSVKRFAATARVPHMGWNRLELVRPARLLPPSEPTPHVYFANSYFVPVCAQTVATCFYGEPFTAVLEEKNIFGVQFHPEKSGPEGLRIMQRFAEL